MKKKEKLKNTYKLTSVNKIADFSNGRSVINNPVDPVLSYHMANINSLMNDNPSSGPLGKIKWFMTNGGYDYEALTYEGSSVFRDPWATWDAWYDPWTVTLTIY